MQISRKQKRVCKDFKIASLDEYHDLYIQSDTYENFQNMHFEIYELDSFCYLTATGLA